MFPQSAWRLLPILLLSIPVASSQAQTTTKKTAPKANVQMGTVANVETAAGAITIKPKIGAEVTYQYTDKTMMLVGKKKVEIDAFKAGTVVVVRFRKSRSGGPNSLYDLCDKPSWDWLNRIRSETTMITIKEIADDGLSGTEGADSALVTYRISEKTLFSKAGKPATITDFKPGAKVYVAPRSLPSGGIMAVAVTDAPDSAAKLKESTKPFISGTIKVLNEMRKTLSLHTTAGDDREFTTTEDLQIHLLGKDVPFTALKLGQQVTVHVTKNDVGETVVNKITIQGAKKGGKPAPKPKPATKPVIKKPTPPSGAAGTNPPGV